MNFFKRLWLKISPHARDTIRAEVRTQIANEVQPLVEKAMQDVVANVIKRGV